MPLETTIDFLAVFKSRRDHCHALLNLSRTQQELIHADDYTGLLVVLGQKQLILGRLDEVASRHRKLFADWKTLRESLAAETRLNCEHILAETEAILAELIEEENNSTAGIVRRRDAAHSELQAINQGTQVNHAYRDALAPTTHRHLDLNQ